MFRSQGPYYVSETESFWDRNLSALVNDTLGLGVARLHGLRPFGDLMRQAFGTTSYLVGGYLQLSGYINNMVVSKWMPENPRTEPKIQALAQLHARSLVLLEEVASLAYMGFPSGATSLARTTHEVRVVARFLHRYEAKFAERYLASHIVDLWKHRADYAPSGAGRRSSAWRATERELDERYREVVAKFGDSMTRENGWAIPRFTSGRHKGSKTPGRVTFAMLEQEVARRYDREYYRLGSRHVHASHLGGIATLSGGGIGVSLLGPRPFGLDKPVHQAMWNVQDIAESLLRSCGHIAEDKRIYYWLEALDQLSYIVRGSFTEGQEALNVALESPPT